MIYLTGDTHGNFDRIRRFCELNNTTKDDVLIILGDAGINYYLNKRDYKLKQELQKFKGFWYNIMSQFHKRICYDKDNNYKIVSDDLYKNGIFTDDENEIANNITRKVKPKDEINNNKNNRKKNERRF